MEEQSCCPECNHELFFGELEIYCKHCGLVVEDEPISLGKEFIGGDLEKAEKMRRTGMPINWLNPDFSTTFDPKESKKIFVSRRH